MSEFAINTLEQIEGFAEQRGCVVVEANPDQLQLDLDSISDVIFYGAMMSNFQEQLGIVEVDRWYSKSNNTHVVLQLRENTPLETRIMLQACLGSDRKREILSYLYAKNNAPHPVVLFKPKGK